MPVSIPPFTNVPAPNDPVSSPWAQQLTQFAVDLIAIQDGQPASADAELWYDTDDAGVSYPNMPRGLVGQALGPTADQTGIGTAFVDASGLTIAFTASLGRFYRSSCQLILGQQVANAQFVDIQITDGANAVKGWTFQSIDVNKSHTIQLWVVENTLSGAQTRKVRVKTSNNTINIQANAAGIQSRFTVEDIGGV